MRGSRRDIVWLSHFIPYPPTSGALERSYHLLAAAARQRPVHLLALDQPRLRGNAVTIPEATAALEQLCASVRVFPLPFERNDVTRAAARALSVLTPAPYDRLWLHSRALHEGARALAQRTPQALVHADTLGLFPYARHFRGAPIVVNHHNVESALVDGRADRDTAGWRRALLRREADKLRRAERAVCPAVAANLVVSPLDARRLAAVAPGSRAYVVSNGVDTQYFRPGEDPGPSGGLIFVGTLGWQANREAARVLATEIWPSLKTDGRRRRLALVGRDPQRREWGPAADEIVAPGYVSDIRPHMREACIVVCPIREGGGTRLKILVALAMGKPLVASSLAVEGLNVIEGQHFLGAESVDEFVAQIRRLEDRPDLRRRLGRMGRELVETEYDWRGVSRELARAYEAAEALESTGW